MTADKRDGVAGSGGQGDVKGEHPGARLRRLMDSHCVGLPGAFNGMVARIAAATGFEGLYVSGAAVTASYGVPDVGLLTLNEFCHVIRQVTQGAGGTGGAGGASGLPVIADADTGFGEGEMVTRTVVEYERAGAAGLHIEDQVFPKRCGHLEGKTLVSVDHFQEKVARAAAARDACSGGTSGLPRRGGSSPMETRGPFIICARTDAAGVVGLDEAIARGKAYLDAGADMLFPEGLTSEDAFAQFAAGVRAHKADCYLLANMTEFGKTPLIPLQRFEELGYSCVIWPVSTFRSAMGEATRLLEALKRDGHVGSAIDGMQTRKELYGALGYEPGVEWVFPGESEARRHEGTKARRGGEDA